ncbi:MAG: hypothetical protein LBT40_00005 [Deltaproteobacteria bacterium]|nr:hypothetical protein [Deltaproteobacteria bacterium]
MSMEDGDMNGGVYFAPKKAELSPNIVSQLSPANCSFTNKVDGTLCMTILTRHLPQPKIEPAIPNE